MHPKTRVHSLHPTRRFLVVEEVAIVSWKEGDGPRLAEEQVADPFYRP